MFYSFLVPQVHYLYIVKFTAVGKRHTEKSVTVSSLSSSFLFIVPIGPKKSDFSSCPTTLRPQLITDLPLASSVPLTRCYVLQGRERMTYEVLAIAFFIFTGWIRINETTQCERPS